MSNKKNNNKPTEDVSDIRDRSFKKRKKRNNRHNNKKFLKDLSKGNIDPFLYQDFMESEESF